MEETTNEVLPETEAYDTELLEQILAELQEMNEEPVLEELETETITEINFEETLLTNQRVSNSLQLCSLAILLLLYGSLLARIIFRKL